MTRDELIREIATALAERNSGFDGHPPLYEDDAVAALTVLAPLLKRVAEGLEPFAAIEGLISQHAVGNCVAVGVKIAHARSASSLHAELKGLLS